MCYKNYCYRSKTMKQNLLGTIIDVTLIAPLKLEYTSPLHLDFIYITIIKQKHPNLIYIICLRDESKELLLVNSSEIHLQYCVCLDMVWMVRVNDYFGSIQQALKALQSPPSTRYSLLFLASLLLLHTHPMFSHVYPNVSLIFPTSSRVIVVDSFIL